MTLWQPFLNEVLTYHYSISPPHRSSLTLLKGIERATSSFPIASCDSPVTYYKTIAQMTDYLLRFVANDQSFVHILDAHDAFITTSCTSDTCVVPSCMNVFVVDSFSLPKAIHMFEQNFHTRPEKIYMYRMSMNGVIHFLLTKHVYRVS
ncbi:diverged REC-like domain-containing protein [Anoxybacillus sp. LAT_35]|uniref:diverged REC-like domain-containing protein n=1 Tax=unclassified Anoxybacillus TaxID=2639704 RepID=UPI001EDA69A7|nr:MULTISPECIES: diverged REC-like domain-containing protein [unclassified Anoxybacillus]MCG5026232.1 diverged REC-like domain-containing protein [Anoxybacillus flavithermus]MCG6196801.1 diverged REC-like domain-containing protein [Anoxybacillus sp. LAT_38]MCG3086280.1 diverged REC-like domain-containing protein [Anoxybacillus sp. LAT27]MCG6173702.1 diverged REC-like domain-containing protein [Anoxybacillus sp. LAT_11]MCG6173737.1 diverged REC-like domain-containing protein [Anoxybacillus sp. 